MQELINYVNPYAQLPPIAGTCKGNLLVIGSAACVWEDLRHYDAVHGAQDRMGINDIIIYYPGRLTHGATLHPEKWPMWRHSRLREEEKQGWPYMTAHSNALYSGVLWPLTRDGGTSGLFGVFVGLLLGYDKIILAGIPCDDSPRFFDPPWQTHDLFGLKIAFDEWQRAHDEVSIFKNRVRSLSGKTQELLGGPDD
jgi:hypothetical protein